MIKVKDVKNAPAILGEKTRYCALQKADALKGLHVSFTDTALQKGGVYFLQLRN